MYVLTQQPSYRKVSPTEAKAFLAVNTFDGQRPLNPLKVSQYATLMMTGKMRAVDIAVASIPGNRKVLMNGQHVCSAIILSNKHWPAIISHYKCETDSDSWHLYASFDVHATRTEGHIMRSARGLFKHSELHEVPLRVLQLCGTALLAIEGKEPKFDAKAMDKTEKPELADKYVQDVLFVRQFSDSRELIRVGVVAAMIATFRANPVKAQKFWTAVSDGQLLMKSDPEYRLRAALIRPMTLPLLKGGRQQHTCYYSLCVLWWNAYVTGETRKIVKLGAMESIPKVLA